MVQCTLFGWTSLWSCQSWTLICWEGVVYYFSYTLPLVISLLRLSVPSWFGFGWSCQSWTLIYWEGVVYYFSYTLRLGTSLLRLSAPSWFGVGWSCQSWTLICWDGVVYCFSYTLRLAISLLRFSVPFWFSVGWSISINGYISSHRSICFHITVCGIVYDSLSSMVSVIISPLSFFILLSCSFFFLSETGFELCLSFQKPSSWFHWSFLWRFCFFSYCFLFDLHYFLLPPQFLLDSRLGCSFKISLVS